MDVQGTTILIIDDDEGVRNSFTQHLEDMEYRVFAAPSGRAGIDMFEREAVDLVMVDLRMPGMDGLEVLEHFRASQPDTPLIVVSGTGEISDAVEALHKGAWDYLLKPIHDFSILQHAIESALEKVRLKRENHQYQTHLEQLVAERTKALKKANRQLRESEGQLRSILDNVRAGIVIVEIDTNKVVYVNPTAAEMATLAGQKLLGLQYDDLFAPLQGDGRPAPDADIPHDPSEGVLKRGDGGQVPVFRTCARATYGGKACLLETFIDQTALKAAAAEKQMLEGQLIQAQKMEAIGTLGGGIAHDFNNILGVMTGCTELALMVNSDEDGVVSQHLHQVLKAGQRAADLVQQILAFSRKREGDQQPLRLSLLVKEVLKMLRATLPATIEIRQDINADTAMVLADPAQMHQIMMNLGTNAAHAMQAGGGVLAMGISPVSFHAAQADMPAELAPGDYLHLSISDTGHGMDGATLDRIFDPYFTTKKPNEGTGLGLAVVMGIVKKHRGAIRVQSQPGQGTRFDLYLPRVDDEPIPDLPLEMEIDDLPRGTERVLLVDDEDQLAGVAGNMIRSLGYTVRVESDSLEALRRFEAQPDRYDLVISDMTMPKMTGDQFSRELLRIRPDIPIILCTGFSSRLDGERARSMGIREYLFKPLRVDQLALKIRQALD